MTGSIPKHRNRYKVAEAKQQMSDKLGGDTLEIVTDDDTVFEIPHPIFYSREIKAALKPLEEDDFEGIARVLFGDDEYDRFVEHDGDPEELSFVFAQVQEDTQAVLNGRKRPTRS